MKKWKNSFFSMSRHVPLSTLISLAPLLLPCYPEEFARANYSGVRIFQKNQKLCHFTSEFAHSNLEFFGILSEIRLEFKWNSSGFFKIHGIPKKIQGRTLLLNYFPLGLWHWNKVGFVF
jgi:hypothetical protein